MHAEAKRILIVSPDSLTKRRQDELLEKLGVTFDIFSREKQEGRNALGQGLAC